MSPQNFPKRYSFYIIKAENEDSKCICIKSKHNNPCLNVAKIEGTFDTEISYQLLVK